MPEAITYTGTDRHGRKGQGRTSTRPARYAENPGQLITRLSREGWQQVTAERDGVVVGEIPWEGEIWWGTDTPS